MAVIKTGVGNGGYALKINSESRAEVNAITLTDSAHAGYEGRSYNISTGSINLTSSAESGVFYLKNTGTKDIVIESFIYMLGNNTGGDAGDNLIQVYRNPTAGTLISAGSDISTRVVNRNFASTNSLTGTFFKGAQGSTVSGGSIVLDSLLTGSGRTVIPVGAIVIPQGTEVAVSITPRTNTSSMNVEVALSVYEKEEL